ncbi:MAG: twitching motility protein PilT [Actinobacteria bacterium]|nr:twitching motility protein PilT [Actinomycetota bacterium]
MSIVYFDTSALAKWYLPERRSEDVEAFLRENCPVHISGLTVVEMRSLLSRRRREGHFDAKSEARAFATFEEDIRKGFLICHTLPADLPRGAGSLISILPDVPLRTLDALHLAMAREIDAQVIATADNVMADAGKGMEIDIVWFGD